MIDAFDDGRTITGLFFGNDESSYFEIGDLCGTTAINLCRVNGEMGPVPWFEVWQGNKLEVRVNAAHVETVQYA